MIRTAQTGITLGQMNVEDGIPGVLLDRLPDQLNRLSVLPPLQCHRAKQMEGVGLVGLCFKDTFADFFSAQEIASLEVAEGLLQGTRLIHGLGSPHRHSIHKSIALVE